MMICVGTHDDGSLAVCEIAFIRPNTRDVLETFWVMKATEARAPGTFTMTATQVADHLGGDIIIDLLDVRHAYAQATALGDWTINLSADGLRQSHTVLEEQGTRYARWKTSAFAKNASNVQQKIHAYCYVHAWTLPNGQVAIDVEPAVVYGFIDDYLVAQAVSDTGMRELIYRMRVRVGATVIQDYAREVSFAASLINTSTNNIDLVGHGFKANSYVKWLSSSGASPAGISVGTIYPVGMLGYLYRYSNAGFFLQPADSLDAGGAGIDFVDQGSGTHTLQTYIYHAVGAVMQPAQIDARPLRLSGPMQRMVPAWYRDEMAYRAKRGMILPIDLDINDNGTFHSWTTVPALQDYRPGVGSIGRPARDPPGGDDMIGPMHKVQCMAMLNMQSASGRAALRLLRIGARESLTIADVVLFEAQAGTNGRPRYTMPVMTQGPTGNGVTYPGMGPCRGLTQIHYNYYGTDGSRIGTRPRQIGGLDMSHPDHCAYGDFAFSASPMSLDATTLLWSRGVLLSLTNYAGDIGDRNHTLPGLGTYYSISMLNRGFQGRAAGYISKFKSLGMEYANGRPERAYIKHLLDQEIACVEAYRADTNLMAPMCRDHGICDAALDGQQIWMHMIINLGALCSIKRRGVFATKPDVVEHFVRLPRILMGDDPTGAGPLRGMPGAHAATLIVSWSRNAWRFPTAEPTTGFAPSQMGGSSTTQDLLFNMGELLSFTSGSDIVTRTMPAEGPRKFAENDIVKLYRRWGNEPPAPYNKTTRYFVYDVNATGTQFKLSTTPAPGVTPVGNATSTVTGVEAFTQLANRASSRWPPLNDYEVANGGVQGSGSEYAHQLQTPLCVAALWGRTDLIPHANLARKFAASRTDDVKPGHQYEMRPNGALPDGLHRYCFAPEYPPLS